MKVFLIPADSPDNVRRNSVFAGYTLGMTAGYAGLYHLWYSRKGFADFRFHNDSRQWLQMDKGGHMMSAYQIGEHGIRLLRWAGVDERRAVWQGGGAGLNFHTHPRLIPVTGLSCWEGTCGNPGLRIITGRLTGSRSVPDHLMKGALSRTGSAFRWGIAGEE